MKIKHLIRKKIQLSKKKQQRTNGPVNAHLSLLHKPTRIVRESDYSPASQLFCRVKKTMTGNYHKLDLVNIDAHTKFGLIMSICSQDIERKRNSDLNKGP